MDTKTTPPRFKPIYNLMTLGFLPAIVNTAIKIGIFTTLEKKGGATAQILGERLCAETTILSAVLDVLSAMGLVDQEGRQYRLSRCGKAFLLDSSPMSQVQEIKAFCQHPGPFDFLSNRLKTGPPDYDPGIFAQKEVIRNITQRTLGGQLEEVVAFICSLPDFESFNLMCDFAGSSGYYSRGLLQKNPCLRSRVYDSPEVAAVVKKMDCQSQTTDRLEIFGIDMDAGRDFGRGYDLFFVSHFLYHWQVQGRLADFFIQVNRAMHPGGVFVSNHTCKAVDKQDYLTQSILELLARTQGYPTLNLDESQLKRALCLGGFGEFKVRPAKDGTYLNNMLVSARKIKEI